MEDLAAQSFFTSRDLLEIEAGDRVLSDRELTEILHVYHVEAEDLVPSRTKLVIDLAERTVAAGGELRTLAGRAPTADEVLASYLSLVYALRRVTPGSDLVLRDADLDVLARALELTKPAVAERLHRLIREPAGELQRRSRLLRGRVLVPMAGVLVAATAVGALVLVQPGAGEAVVPEPGSGPEPAFVVANPDGTTTPVFVGDGLDPADLPAGAVGLAPATQQDRDGPLTVHGDGQPVASEQPPGEVWVGEAQVVAREPGAATPTTQAP